MLYMWQNLSQQEHAKAASLLFAKGEATLKMLYFLTQPWALSAALYP